MLATTSPFSFTILNTELFEEGIYYRGSNQGCRDEIPRHPVRIKAFSIDIHPVTNEQFVRFLDFLRDEKDHQNQGSCGKDCIQEV